LICASAAAGVLGALASNAYSAELTRAQLTTRIVGNTIQYHLENEDVFEFIAPDGLIRGMSTVHGKYLGRWRIRDDDTICFEHDDPMQSGCVSVVLNQGTVEYHRRDDVVEGPFPLLKGNPRNL
jgi:hypothetical protein